MARKKCKDCLSCFNVCWVDNKRYYHCWLCNTWYEGRDDNLQQTSNPYVSTEAPMILEEQPVEETMRYPFICNDCGSEFELSISVQDYEFTAAFPCEVCHSSNTKRVYKTAPPAHYVGKDFTKSVDQEDET